MTIPLWRHANGQAGLFLSLRWDRHHKGSWWLTFDVAFLKFWRGP